MFADRQVNDFKAELVSVEGVDRMRLSIEIARGAYRGPLGAELRARIKNTFEISPEIVVLEAGTLAREFESSVKAPRFVDARQ